MALSLALQNLRYSRKPGVFPMLLPLQLMASRMAKYKAQSRRSKDFTKGQESGHSEHLALLDRRNIPPESAQAQHST